MLKKLEKLLDDSLWFVTVTFHLMIAFITTITYLFVAIATKWLGKL
jgi:hypothetical protein